VVRSSHIQKMRILNSSNQTQQLSCANETFVAAEMVKVKVNQSRYRPGQAQRVPEI